MKIGVDATCWQNQRGYGRHARALLKKLVELSPENQYTFIIDSLTGTEDIPASVDVNLVPARVPASEAASATGHRTIRDMWAISRALSRPGWDAIIYPTVYTYVPAFSAAKKVVVIHDAIPEVYPELTLPDRSSRRLWQIKSALARRQADAIVTVSDYSRDMLVEHLRVPFDKIFVVGEASDPVFRVLEDDRKFDIEAGSSIPESGRLILYVGGFGPHKNVISLVRGFSQLAQDTQFTDARLILVGEYRNEVFHSQIAEILRETDAPGVGEKIVFTGYITDEELVALMNRASVLVLPSLMEGFGLPAIEAAACGCPVIATRESPLPKLLDGGGVFFDPTSLEELVAAMKTVLGSAEVWQSMRSAGLAAASRLTWEQAARQMIEVLHKVVPG
jgi:alpha-1,3-rhamnosyl/mannosyltransferase